MKPVYFAFTVGLFIGTWVGVIIMGLLYMARDPKEGGGDEKTEKEG